MNRAVPALVLGVSLLATACGGGGATSPGASAASSAAPLASPGASHPADPGSNSGPVGASVEACDLLSDDDIIELTSLEVGSATPGTTQGVWRNGCEWKLGENSIDSLVLGVLQPGGRAMWDRSFKPFGDEMGQEPIEGLGDEALLGEDNDVMAVQGDALVSIQFLSYSKPSDEDVINLVRRVLENLSGG